MSSDVYTDTYLDTYGSDSGGGGTPPTVTTWQLYGGGIPLYPYLLAADGTLIPLFVKQVGTDRGTSLSAVVGDLGTVTLTWTLVAGASGYQVSRDGGDGVSVSVGQGATSYVFDQLVHGQLYTFEVRPLPAGPIATLTVTAVNLSTPPSTGSGFGHGPFGHTPFGR